MDTKSLVRNSALGAAGGIAAALAMNAFQAGWGAVSARLQPEGNGSGGGEPSTVEAADRLAQATIGQPVPRKQRGLAGEAVHYGFGAFLGALYGAAATVFPQARTGRGAPFGAAVWAVADETLVPAAGLSKPSTEAPASTHLYSLASHLVFGMALDAAQSALQRLRLVNNGRRRQAA